MKPTKIATPVPSATTRRSARLSKSSMDQKPLKTRKCSVDVRPKVVAKPSKIRKVSVDVMSTDAVKPLRTRNCSVDVRQPVVARPIVDVRPSKIRKLSVDEMPTVAVRPSKKRHLSVDEMSTVAKPLRMRQLSVDTRPPWMVPSAVMRSPAVMRSSAVVRSPAVKTPARTSVISKNIDLTCSNINLTSDPVQVFCRIRPILGANSSCVQVLSNSTVALITPENAVNYRVTSVKEMQYVFEQVFDEKSTQQEVYDTITEPLVTNLMNGKNGVLFTYGVTGSGKTYTMTGNADNRGIMPRCLDAIFNKQTNDANHIFTVLVTYIEIYNNSVFDLLEEPLPGQKSLQSNIIREDASHNVFVHGVTEVEVKYVEEALNVLQLGQKRKRMSPTILNSESSRSHSVFTIRLTQTNVQTNCVTTSQLSLVDLAGNERTSRTNNTGHRLTEAGNINNSLMTLRSCLEILRENQKTGGSKRVPYRDSKLTHLFKNYFEGNGAVKIIVCMNPRVEDYDENVQVMKFAEIAQKVQITNTIETEETEPEPMSCLLEAELRNKKLQQELEELKKSKEREFLQLKKDLKKQLNRERQKIEAALEMRMQLQFDLYKTETEKYLEEMKQQLEKVKTAAKESHTSKPSSSLNQFYVNDTPSTDNDIFANIAPILPVIGQLPSAPAQPVKERRKRGPKEQEDPRINKIAEGKFQCSFCQKVFGYKKNCKRHLKNVKCATK